MPGSISSNINNGEREQVGVVGVRFYARINILEYQQRRERTSWSCWCEVLCEEQYPRTPTTASLFWIFYESLLETKSHPEIGMALRIHDLVSFTT
jgi:hypothetical protein